MSHRSLVIFGLLLTAAAPQRLTAQFGPPDTTTGPPRGATTFGIGYQALEVTDFNSVLRANGLPEMAEGGLATSLATEVRFGRWEFGVNGGGVSGGSEETSTWRTKVSGKALSFTTGFALIDGGKWRVAPSAGVGLTRVNYHVEQVRGGSVDSVAADPLRGTDLNGQTGSWQAGLNIEYRIGRRMGQKMSIAVRAGYVEAFGDSDWRADDNDLSTGPRAAYGGLYARLGLTVGMPRRREAVLPSLFSVVPWLSR